MYLEKKLTVIKQAFGGIKASNTIDFKTSYELNNVNISQGRELERQGENLTAQNAGLIEQLYPLEKLQEKQEKK